MLQAEKAKVKRERLEAKRVAQEGGRLDLPTASDEQTVVAPDAEETLNRATGLQPMTKDENESLKKLREVRIIILSKH
jgi:hypothetical protein